MTDDVLTINHVDYFSKSTVDKMVADVRAEKPKIELLPKHESLNDDKLELWSYTQFEKLTKHVKQFISRDPHMNHISSEIAYHVANLQLLDPANVCSLRAKSMRARLVLAQFFFVMEDYSSLIEAKNHTEKLEFDKNPVCDFSRFSSEYVTKALALVNIGSDSFKLRAKKDFPLVIETEDWEIIIAPRVEHD